MSKKLVLIVVIFTIILFVGLIKLINDKKMSVKYSLVWILPLSLFLLVSFIPNFVTKIAVSLGFETLVSFIFCVLFVFLLFICISLTVIVSKLRSRQKLVIQELSLLKSMYSKDKNK